MATSPPALPAAAIGFNVFNAETILGVAAAVSESGHSVYLQTSASTVRCYGAAALAGMINALIPAEIRHRVVLHLDHCDADSLFRECLDAGWKSVMIDASARPLAENIRRTREIIAMARPYQAFVEAEIGVVGGEEDGFDSYASAEVKPAVEHVLQFIDETCADLVAVGVGTRHGHYEQPCQVDQALLECVHHARPQAALVLHGGSGIPEEQLRLSVQRGGIRKINISTEIKDAWLGVQRRHIDGLQPHQVIAGVKSAVSAVQQSALTKMHLLASFSA
ncbi:MAG TPA: class II fructose-bisphosphate aldolase [Verrucomicrobiales bacterium]|nr:class II fructose-bisphosphate aldolase [Verrucomicrobiales bacterium]